MTSLFFLDIQVPMGFLRSDSVIVKIGCSIFWPMSLSECFIQAYTFAKAVLGPVHMGRSYLGSRENISTGQIMLFCSYGEMFSRLPGKVSRGDVDFVKCKQKVFLLSGKVVFI